MTSSTNPRRLGTWFVALTPVTAACGGAAITVEASTAVTAEPSTPAAPHVPAPQLAFAVVIAAAVAYACRYRSAMDPQGRRRSRHRSRETPCRA